MDVYPHQTIVSPGRFPFAPSDNPMRGSPLSWLRRRRRSAAESRTVHRLDQLGTEWHVVEWPYSVPPTRDPADPADPSAAQGAAQDAGFLAIGPGGIYSVTVVDHGRSRVLIAGDVVQVGSRRPPYTALARKDARRAAQAISAAIGHEIVVHPVLAFVGSANISVYGLPKDCLLTTYRELDRMLSAAGRRISPATADKLALVARAPRIWIDAPYRTDTRALPVGHGTPDDTVDGHE